MTCKEKLIKDHPHWDDEIIRKTIDEQCPDVYGYLGEPEKCTPERVSVCRTCWDREIPEAEITVNTVNPYASATYKDPLKTPIIKDSGDRTEFATGAVRDMREGKGRCDLMPLAVVANLLNGRSLPAKEDGQVMHNVKTFLEKNDTYYLYLALEHFADKCYGRSIPTMFLEVAKHFEEGAKKYGENNWQKGIPVHCYIDSAVRHYLKWKRGDNDEPHDRAFVWNIMCCIWEVDYHEK